eukprot:GHVS01091839.1.p1 GENE.GHVS01091839.1~~GHVS01091839.1.p1  ORF type:complete len:431 (+),score=194.45 GHVS01091839.1:51-1343(+)
MQAQASKSGAFSFSFKSTSANKKPTPPSSSVAATAPPRSSSRSAEVGCLFGEEEEDGTTVGGRAAAVVYGSGGSSLYSSQIAKHLDVEDASIFDYDGYCEEAAKPAAAAGDLSRGHGGKQLLGALGRKEPIRLGFVEERHRRRRRKTEEDDEEDEEEEEGRKLAERREGGGGKEERGGGKSKYIGKLLTTSKRRQIERDIVEEKRLLNERKQEKDKYADSEAFVTSAYKKKLEERAEVQREMELEAIEELRNDVTKKDTMSKFHLHLLTSGLGSRLTRGGGAEQEGTNKSGQPNKPTGAAAAAAVVVVPAEEVEGGRSTEGGELVASTDNGLCEGKEEEKKVEEEEKKVEEEKVEEEEKKVEEEEKKVEEEEKKVEEEEQKKVGEKGDRSIEKQVAAAVVIRPREMENEDDREEKLKAAKARYLNRAKKT